MTDLDERLRLLDRLESPDLWGDIGTREPGRLSAVRPVSRWAPMTVAAVVAALGIGLVVRAFLGGDGIVPRLGGGGTPSGHHILLPDEPSRTDDRGVLILEATTNLPEGTLVDIGVGGPDIEGASGGHPVKDGLIEIQVAMNACRMTDGELQAPAIGVVVIAAPFEGIPGHSRAPHPWPPSPDPPRQPADVRAVLGDRFENLQGEQVQSDERGNFISVSKSYEFDPNTCTHFLVDTEGGGLRQIPLRPPLEGVEQTLPWCPEVSTALPLEGADTQEAASVALRFDASIYDDSGEYRDLADPVVRFPSEWFPTGEQEPGLDEFAFISGIPATAGKAVERSCGPEVADRTWQVVLGDGEYDLALVSYYLVLRTDGWRVWGTLEGHGEVKPPY